MKLFSPLYLRAMRWARHRRAPWFLGGLSFAESSFFPIPPDVMLAPMAMARPEQALRYALLTTLASVAGGVLGYLIGMLFLDLIAPLLHEHGYWEKFELAQAWFDRYGFWAILIAGFSPIPYKVFTIAAGAMAMPFLPFVVASFIGRGARFFLVAALMKWGGEPMEKKLHVYIDHLGWATVAAALIGYLVFK
ncbi:MAG TPA: DedA family protein [Gammaproteobacteria bacterium]|nr:DedA family protein [Gammaproteobacteria bacterium]